MQVYPARAALTEPASPQSFTGHVWRTLCLPPGPSRSGEEGSGLVGHRFVYEPGARSHWHVHQGDQALVVLEGHGLVVWRTDEAGSDAIVARAVGPADWVHVTPGVEHWHGAMPEDVFSHLAATASGGTRWLEPVTDEEYARAQAQT